jgi:hypothetical protein
MDKQQRVVSLAIMMVLMVSSSSSYLVGVLACLLATGEGGGWMIWSGRRTVWKQMIFLETIVSREVWKHHRFPFGMV